MLRSPSALVVLLGLGCGSSSRPVPDADSDTDTDTDTDTDVGPDCGSTPDPDLTAPYFEPDHVLEVEIEIDPDDWDALRTETRTLQDLLVGRDCLDDPFGSPFTWFPATVTIDGDVVENVHVRKKGFLGSLDEQKPSLKVKLDLEEAGRRIRGEDDFTLNNSRQDASFVKQCIVYRVFADAGIPSPRCNFAHVTVNGTDLGPYVHVERVDRDFLCRHFEDDRGNLYEGTLSDFKEGWTGTFEPKTNEETADRSEILAVVDALDVPDADLAESLEGVLDFEGFVAFWATEVLVGHWDGYAGNTNNFYVYGDPSSELLQFMPWGADGVLFPRGEESSTPYASVMANGALARRLYGYGPTQDTYVTALRALLDHVWIEDDLLAEVDRMEEVVTPLARPEELSRLAGSVESVREFVRTQRTAIEAELDSGPPAWDQPEREIFCFIERGLVEGTFSTTWGTIAEEDPFAVGSGTAVVRVDDVPWRIASVGAKSGPDTDQPDRAAVHVIVALRDGSFGGIVMTVHPALFSPGADVPFDFGSAFGAVFHFDPRTEAFVIVGVLMEGSIRLDEASIVDGEPVSGSFAAPLYEWPF